MLVKRVLYGFSYRNYKMAEESVLSAIGLYFTTVCRHLIKANAERLRELNERELLPYNVVAMILDGKSFAEDTLVIAL